MPQPVDSAVVAAFRQEQLTRLPTAHLATSLLGMGAFASYALVDPLLVEGSVRPLLLARALLVSILGTGLLLGRSRWGRRHVHALTIAASLVIGWGVVWVTVLAGGLKSNYHEALLLTFFGFGLLVPWRGAVAGSVFTAIVAGYDLALPLAGQIEPIPTFVTNNAILWTGAVISSVGVVVADRLRLGEFRSRGDLKEANERLKELDRAKSRFFANLSHELRTPLTLTLAPIEALMDEGGEPMSPTQREHLALIRRSALRLLKLVDDLLELSRLEAARVRLRLQSVDLLALLRDLVEQVEPLAARKHIALSMEAAEGAPPAPVAVDPDQIERVVLNVLANAVKFTDDGGRIDAALRETDGGLEISVRDTGVGIPQEDLERVFERFHQVDDSSTRRHGGTGIGLALARELVELHAGWIRAESELGAGTTIRFWLPRTQAAEQAPLERRQRSETVGVERRQAEGGLPEWHAALRRRDEYRLLGIADATERRIVPRSHAPGRKETVLVVEDNPVMIRFLAGMLGAQHEILAATDGVMGLSMAKTRLPDLIVSDVMMPGMNGFELLRALRADANTATIPLILLTARGDTDDRITGAEHGADAYLAKPFQAAELNAVIESLLRKTRRTVAESQAQREDALRTLAEGIAHEILNPLGFLQNAMFLLKENTEEARAAAAAGDGGARLRELEQEARVSYEVGREGVARMKDAIEQLRAFARGGALGEPRASEANALVERVLTLVGRPRDGVKLHTELRAARSVRARPGQVEQVLLNLVINAQQALGAKGGEIHVRSWDDEDGGVGYAVRDDGPGIALEDREKIFYPFYTTKDPGLGTGLGLALSRQIAREHGGSLTVDSRPGEGATFTLKLPAAGTGGAGAATALAKGAAGPLDSGTSAGNP
jgi:signal transduction histidine kinase